MSNIQKTLDALQPFVIGIRYVGGMPVIDTVFKDGWTLPDSTKINKTKGNDELNYYMIYSETEGIGLDDLLAYVDKTIKLNIDREKKHTLLKAKVEELKEVFKKNTLDTLTKLKFTFGEQEELTTDITDIDLDEKVVVENIIIQEQGNGSEEQEKERIKQLIAPQNTQFLDADKNPIPISDEDREAAEEELRAQAFIKTQKLKKLNGEVKKVNKVELPPKKVNQPKMEIAGDQYCDCDEDQYCNKCIDRKGL